MKKFIYLIFLFFAALPTFSQSKPIPKGTTDEFARLIAVASLDYLRYKYLENEQVFKPVDFKAAFKSYLDTLSVKDEALIANKEKIENSYSDISALYSTDKAYASWIDNKCSVKILDYYPGSKVIIFSNLLYKSIFNTMTVKDKERATKIAKEIAAPLLMDISRNFSDSQYIGIVVAYGSKNFGDKYDSSSSDCMLMVVDVKTAIDFKNLRIAEDVFISKCDFYIKNGDSDIPYLRKVDLSK